MLLRRSVVMAVAVLAATGCEGSIDGTVEGVTPPRADDPTVVGPPAKGSCSGTAGHYALRRLTNREYTNSVQDLLFTTARPGDALQESPTGASGFTNDSYALSIYSALVGTMYDQAETLAHAVIASKGTSNGAYGKLVTCQPSQSTCALDTVTRLARRALRRQPTAEDLDATNGLMGVFAAGGTFDQGLNDVLVTLLTHPEFLTIPVVDAQSLNPSARFALDDDEVASRLSYFLWESMPDDALFALADSKQLHDPAVLSAQVKRMLGDARAAHLKATLRDELAGVLSFSRSDFTQLGQTNALRDAMVGETDAFFDDLIKNDRSPLSLLDSQQRFANKTLADFYGLTFPANTNPATFVSLASDRRGLATQAAVLVSTAGGSASFTNPIKRGHWLASKVLCAEPPPPPPMVPPLPAAGGSTATIRDRLSVHVANPSCAGCHVTMDAVGLGAENYDALGRWRTTYSDGHAVDATGALPDGTAFSDSRAMFDAIANSEQARGCVAQQFFKLALNRALQGDDVCAAEKIASVHVAQGATLSGLLTAIASSDQFLTQTGEAP
ncbi:MAG: DUF1592 domain-containing protein [Myxococcaceae bacterium]